MIHSIKYTGTQLDDLLDKIEPTETKANESYEILTKGFTVKTQYRSEEVEIFGLDENKLIVQSEYDKNRLPILKIKNKNDLSDEPIEVYYDKNTGNIMAKSKVPVNQIVLPGNPGAGLGLAPDSTLTSLGLERMNGTDNPNSDNFGNYVHTSSGSIMCYIPKHYVKITNDVSAPYYGLRVDISQTQKPGYFLPRVFINAGKIQDGIFIDKYTNSSSKGYYVQDSIPISVRNGVPIVSNACNRLYDPTTQKTNTRNYLSAMIEVCKGRGSRFFITSCFAYSMLNDIADACWQQAYRMANIEGTLDKMSTICAWADREPYRIRGNWNNLIDNDDHSVRYTPDNIVSGRGLVASVDDSVFAKICHNGQKCGITDINGNVWLYAHGLYHTYIIKESTDISTLTRADCLSSAVTSNGKFQKVNGVNTMTNDSYRWLGKDTDPLWNGDTDRTSDDYIRHAIGITNTVSTARHRRYGCRIYWNNSTSNSNCLYGARWDDSDAGSRSCNSYSFDDSSTNVGFCLSLYPL